jgi:hypothetical protein
VVPWFEVFELARNCWPDGLTGPRSSADRAADIEIGGVRKSKGGPGDRFGSRVRWTGARAGYGAGLSALCGDGHADPRWERVALGLLGLLLLV